MEKPTYDLDSFLDISHQEALEPNVLILMNKFTKKWADSVREYAKKAVKSTNQSQINAYYEKLSEKFLKDANNKYILRIKLQDGSDDIYHTIHNGEIHKPSGESPIELKIPRQEDYMRSAIEQATINHVEMFSKQINLSKDLGEKTNHFLTMQLLFLTLTLSVLFENRQEAVVAQNTLNATYDDWLKFEIITLEEYFNILREDVIQEERK